MSFRSVLFSFHFLKKKQNLNEELGQGVEILVFSDQGYSPPSCGKGVDQFRCDVNALNEFHIDFEKTGGTWTGNQKSEGG